MQPKDFYHFELTFSSFLILDKTGTIIRSDTNEELPENERWTVGK